MTGIRSPNTLDNTSFGDHDAKSAVSHKSTQSTRSSVLERAREYNRRIEDENRRRSKSLDQKSEGSPPSVGNPDSSNPGNTTPRSQSAGRSGTGGNRISTRERALASVRNETTVPVVQRHHNAAPTPVTPKTPRTPTTARKEDKPARNSPSRRSHNEGEGHAVVTPELLVDALSGHEDGLLAIAERLMEHYDHGYDVMGEAIIDAFADVQKLFQHVVEAAHMEGAAFESSRREQEMAELRKQAKGELPDDGLIPPSTTNGLTRHDEFIDQDVKDALTEAIRKGAPLREANRHTECYQLFEAACQSASALLPVDSDHRGRLQLSIARAESMSPDRACAILRYAMDDVLRSGLIAGRAPLPDPSKRGDCVLSKPKDHPSLNGNATQAGVIQSSEEALASLVEEMKEVLGAPVYDNTPLQSVAQRFWVALGEAQRSQLKNEEKLEHNLGKLKGEFLLARAEWEEKLTMSQENAETYKRKYLKLKDSSKAENYMDQARSSASKLSEPRSDDEHDDVNLTFDTNRPRGPGSVASLSSGLAHHARSIVGSFACSGINERSGGVLAAELHESKEARRSSSAPRSPTRLSNNRSFSSQSFATSNSRSSSIPRRSRSSKSAREV